VVDIAATSSVDSEAIVAVDRALIWLTLRDEMMEVMGERAFELIVTKVTRCRRLCDKR
jgi:hypothetical protein